MRRFKNAKALAAFIGVTPRLKESGSSVRGRSMISRSGHATIRHSLYMPAMVALKYNPLIKAFGQRLAAEDLAPKAMINASMHKLVRFIHGVLKAREVFNAQFFWKARFTFRTVSDPCACCGLSTNGCLRPGD